MGAAAEIGRNPVSKHQIQPLSVKNDQIDAGRGGRTRLAILPRREQGQGNIHFPCSTDHKKGWQPFPVDLPPYFAISHAHTFNNIQSCTPLDIR